MQRFEELKTLGLPVGVLLTLSKKGFTHGLFLPNKKIKVRKWSDGRLVYDYFDLPEKTQPNHA